MTQKIARNLSLRHFRAFVAVAKAGSFSRAAEALAISQPALTLSIQQFEQIVGVKLLNRTTRAVSLTGPGQDMLPKAEAVLRDVEAAVLSARSSAEAEENRVVIAALPSVAIRILPQAITGFAAHAPQVAIHTQDDNGRGVEAQVLDGRADFGISNAWSDDPGLTRTPFIRDQMGLICRADHPLAHRKTPLGWADLSDLPFVGMASDTGVNRLLENRRDLPASIQDPAFRVLTIAALVGIVENGTAVSALPALAAPDYLNPSLVYRGLTTPILYRDLQIITAKGRPPSPAAQSVMGFLAAYGVTVSAMFPNTTVTPGTAAD